MKNKARTSKPRPATRPRSQSSSTRRAAPGRTAGKSIASGKRGSATRERAVARSAASGKQASATRKRAAGKPIAPRRPASAKGRRPAAQRAATRTHPARRGPARSRQLTASRWLTFVEQHGVVLASARGPVPSLAEAVAGQPIVGSWWAHPRGKAIFAALSELDDSDDVRCFKLVDGKVTFVHRRMWPALARLASDGVLDAARVASIQQEHMPTGEHRNLITPFPDWVPEDVARAATGLTVETARAQLGPWV